MPWYALQSLDDARRATTSLLSPIDRGRWLRLAVLAFFVAGAGGGGGGGGGQGSVNVSGDTFGDVPFPAPTGLPTESTLLAAIAALIVLLFLLALVYVAVGSVMEFVLVEGLRTEHVRIRGPFRTYFGEGMRLFAFRVVVGLIAAGIVVVPIVAVILGGVSVSPAFLLLLIPVLLLFGLVALVVGVGLQLTTDFVVPTMLAEERTLLDAWRRLLPTFRADWEQLALYVIVRYALAIAAAIAVGLVVVLLALVVALPFVIVGGVGYALLVAVSGSPDPGVVGWVALGLLGALYGLVVVVVALFVQVPVMTYLRYYGLFVLGAFDADLDLVASFRERDDRDGDAAETVT